MINGFLSLYQPSYLKTIVYMLQSSEYEISPYFKWYWHVTNFSKVTNRKQLDLTRAAEGLLWLLRIGAGVEILIGLLLIYLCEYHGLVGGTAFGLALIVIYPVLWAHLIVVPIVLSRELIVKPKIAKKVEKSDAIFSQHPAKKIAVAGSYGKTTMKELLLTVLGEGLNVVATPANKNVSSSHAQFALGLTGKEDVLIIEYGEGAPGDVKKFAKYTHPTHAIITGLAPAHLNHYKTLAEAGEDIFSVAFVVPKENVYVNGESSSVKPFIQNSYHLFDRKGALGWKVTDVNTSITGTDFVMKKGTTKLKLTSNMLGQHQIGYLAFVAALALDFGLSQNQVISGIAKTKPYEHRMQPYKLAGAWVVDDTYNGNLEGIRAGTDLLRILPAKRKIYVTPGLVDQGIETASVHKEVGKLIAKAQPDLVVLMKNSVTQIIQEGLKKGHFKGELRIETEPLNFYQNLTHFVAAGDLIIMQNDWPDNYK